MGSLACHHKARVVLPLDCRPLQAMEVHGLSTQWTYDDCVSNVDVPNATNVLAVTTGQGTHYDYAWTTGGVISYHVQPQVVSHESWQLEGYTCRPSAKESNYGLSISYDECLEMVRCPDPIPFVPGWADSAWAAPA